MEPLKIRVFQNVYLKRVLQGLFLFAGAQSAFAACIICKPVGGGAEFEYNGSYCPSYTTYVRACPVTTPVLPGAPWLSYTMKSTTSFEMSWSDAGGTSFKYQGRFNGGAWSAQTVVPSKPFTLSVTQTGAYEYKVFACNANGCGSQSNVISVNVTLPELTVSENLITYTYDTMGRLTFVEDGINGNRDYDYDKVGNRDAVSVGNAEDSVPLPPAPPAPSGLSCSLIAPNVYKASWTAVSGASYYVIRSTAVTNPESQITSTTHYIDQGGATCNWVKACNSSSVCSAKSYF